MTDQSRSVAFCLHGESQNDSDIYVMLNAFWEPLSFRIQEGSVEDWRRVVDTGRASPDDILEPGREAQIPAFDYTVGARSVVVLVRRAGTS